MDMGEPKARRIMIHGTLRAAVVALMVAAPACDILTPDLDGNGVVRFIDIEGGCWTIEAAGDLYEPIDLPAAFQEDGLEVDFEAVERDDLASICQVGPIVELLRISAAE